MVRKNKDHHKKGTVITDLGFRHETDADRLDNAAHNPYILRTEGPSDYHLYARNRRISAGKSVSSQVIQNAYMLQTYQFVMAPIEFFEGVGREQQPKKEGGVAGHSFYSYASESNGAELFTGYLTDEGVVTGLKNTTGPSNLSTSDLQFFRNEMSGSAASGGGKSFSSSSCDAARKSLEVALISFDIMPKWDNIQAVVVRTTVDHYICPVCLEIPVAPRMTRCGHIYCYSCILRAIHQGKALRLWSELTGYPTPGLQDKEGCTSLPSLSVSNAIFSSSPSLSKKEMTRKCPMCSTIIGLSELRPCIFEPVAVDQATIPHQNFYYCSPQRGPKNERVARKEERKTNEDILCTTEKNNELEEEKSTSHCQSHAGDGHESFSDFAERETTDQDSVCGGKRYKKNTNINSDTLHAPPLYDFRLLCRPHRATCIVVDGETYYNYVICKGAHSSYATSNFFDSGIPERGIMGEDAHIPKKLKDLLSPAGIPTDTLLRDMCRYPGNDVCRYTFATLKYLQEVHENHYCSISDQIEQFCARMVRPFEEGDQHEYESMTAALNLTMKSIERLAQCASISPLDVNDFESGSEHFWKSTCFYVKQKNRVGSGRTSQTFSPLIVAKQTPLGGVSLAKLGTPPLAARWSVSGKSPVSLSSVSPLWSSGKLSAQQAPHTVMGRVDASAALANGLGSDGLSPPISLQKSDYSVPVLDLPPSWGSPPFFPLASTPVTNKISNVKMPCDSYNQDNNNGINTQKGVNRTLSPSSDDNNNNHDAEEINHQSRIEVIINSAFWFYQSIKDPAMYLDSLNVNMLREAYNKHNNPSNKTGLPPWILKNVPVMSITSYNQSSRERSARKITEHLPLHTNYKVAYSNFSGESRNNRYNLVKIVDIPLEIRSKYKLSCEKKLAMIKTASLNQKFRKAEEEREDEERHWGAEDAKKKKNSFMHPCSSTSKMHQKNPSEMGSVSERGRGGESCEYYHYQLQVKMGGEKDGWDLTTEELEWLAREAQAGRQYQQNASAVSNNSWTTGVSPGSWALRSCTKDYATLGTNSSFSQESSSVLLRPGDSSGRDGMPMLQLDASVSNEDGVFAHLDDFGLRGTLESMVTPSSLGGGCGGALRQLSFGDIFPTLENTVRASGTSSNGGGSVAGHSSTWGDGGGGHKNRHRHKNGWYETLMWSQWRKGKDRESGISPLDNGEEDMLDELAFQEAEREHLIKETTGAEGDNGTISVRTGGITASALRAHNTEREAERGLLVKNDSSPSMYDILGENVPSKKSARKVQFDEDLVKNPPQGHTKRMQAMVAADKMQQQTISQVPNKTENERTRGVSIVNMFSALSANVDLSRGADQRQLPSFAFPQSGVASSSHLTVGGGVTTHQGGGVGWGDPLAPRSSTTLGGCKRSWAHIATTPEQRKRHDAAACSIIPTWGGHKMEIRKEKK